MPTPFAEYTIPPSSAQLIEDLDQIFSHSQLYPTGSESHVELGIKLGKRQLINQLKEKLSMADAS